MTLFVDSSGFIAVLDECDSHHKAASGVWQEALRSREPLLTSNYVVAESAAVVQRKYGMTGLRNLLQGLLPAVTVAWVSLDEHNTAIAAALSADRRGLSLVDCISFEVMLRLGLRRALTVDQHFAEQGFDLAHLG